jgi:hypothetical protein
MKSVVGKRFGHLVVISTIRNQNGSAQYRCQCDCGEICEKWHSALKPGAHCGHIPADRSAWKDGNRTPEPRTPWEYEGREDLLIAAQEALDAAAGK